MTNISKTKLSNLIHSYHDAMEFYFSDNENLYNYDNEILDNSIKFIIQEVGSIDKYNVDTPRWPETLDIAIKNNQTLKLNRGNISNLDYKQDITFDLQCYTNWFLKGLLKDLNHLIRDDDIIVDKALQHVISGINVAIETMNKIISSRIKDI